MQREGRYNAVPPGAAPTPARRIASASDPSRAARATSPRAAARAEYGVPVAREAEAHYARVVRAARPRGDAEAPSRASSASSASSSPSSALFVRVRVELVSRARGSARFCFFRRASASARFPSQKATEEGAARRVERPRRVRVSSRVLRRAHGGSGLVRHRRGRARVRVDTPSKRRPFDSVSVSVSKHVGFGFEKAAPADETTAGATPPASPPASPGRPARAPPRRARTPSGWFSVLPRNVRVDPFFARKRARARRVRTREEPPGRPSELLDLRLRPRRCVGSFVASSSRAAPWYVSGWNVLSAFSAFGPVCLYPKMRSIQAWIDRLTGSHSSASRCFRMKTRGLPLPRAGAGRRRSSPSTWRVPIRRFRAFTRKSPEPQKNSGTPALTRLTSASDKSAPSKDSASPWNRRSGASNASSADAGGARGRSGAASTARTRGSCSACRTGNDSRVCLAHRAVPVAARRSAWPRASAPRARGTRGAAPARARATGRRRSRKRETSSRSSFRGVVPQDPLITGHCDRSLWLRPDATFKYMR